MKLGDKVYVLTFNGRKQIELIARGKIHEKVYIQDDDIIVQIKKVLYRDPSYTEIILRDEPKSYNKFEVFAFDEENSRAVIRWIWKRPPWLK